VDQLYCLVLVLTYFHESFVDDFSNAMISSKYVFGSWVRSRLFNMCDCSIIITY